MWGKGIFGQDWTLSWIIRFHSDFWSNSRENFPLTKKRDATALGWFVSALWLVFVLTTYMREWFILFDGHASVCLLTDKANRSAKLNDFIKRFVFIVVKRNLHLWNVAVSFRQYLWNYVNVLRRHHVTIWSMRWFCYISDNCRISHLSIRTHSRKFFWILCTDWTYGPFSDNWNKWLNR